MAAKTYPITKKEYELILSESNTPEVQLVRLQATDGSRLDFDPGMFAMIMGVEKGTGKLLVRRAYSIASEPNADYLEFYVVKEHDGHVTYFMQSKKGDKYVIEGPYGQFAFVPEENKKVLFIAGGTGFAPFMSMLRHIKKIGAGTDVVLIYSIKFPTEIIMKDELMQLAESLKIKSVITVTRPQAGDGWNGQTGHVNADMIMKSAPDIMERTVYVCGPLPFVKAIKDALASLNVPNNRVKADVWG
ncbi:FAD-binding oxidoreductase [Candidatus Marsarchaeota archaeon]|nr:FAD-binding oxidoreductase [Candidatus Marsarchaeota archaeon]MCL5404370.1 FAD-binding oxidoreductase [Candidatus Marsarchaeota archaeon]